MKRASEHRNHYKYFIPELHTVSEKVLSRVYEFGVVKDADFVSLQQYSEYRRAMDVTSLRYGAQKCLKSV